MSNNKQSMKLYTEEQMKEAIRMARSSYNLFTTPFIYEHDEVLEQLTSIELPSDEEIKEEMGYDGFDPDYIAFYAGIDYMRDKIQGGNNEQR